MIEETASDENALAEGKARYWVGEGLRVVDQAEPQASSNQMLTVIGGFSVWCMGLGALVLFIAIFKGDPVWGLVGGWGIGLGVSIGFSWMCITAIALEIRKLKSSG